MVFQLCMTEELERRLKRGKVIRTKQNTVPKRASTTPRISHKLVHGVCPLNINSKN